MVQGAQGLGGINPAGNQNKDTSQIQQNIKDAAELMKEQAQVIDTELAFMGDKAKPNKSSQNNGNTNIADPKQQKSAHLTQEAAAATQMTDEVEKKKKKKETLFEEKMAQLSHLEGATDETMLNEEEKGVFQEFFENLARFRTLREKLTRLQKQKKKYEELLEEKKKQEKKSKQGR